MSWMDNYNVGDRVNVKGGKKATVENKNLVGIIAKLDEPFGESYYPGVLDRDIVEVYSARDIQPLTARKTTSEYGDLSRYAG